VEEGLSGLVREASSKNMFTRYKVGSEKVEVNSLQYVDDTIFVGKMTLKNVVMLKRI